MVIAVFLLPDLSCDLGSFNIGPLFSDPCTTSDDELIRAATDGDVAEVSTRIEQGADPNVFDRSATPMRCAVRHHRGSVVAVLVGAGVRPSNSTIVDDAARAGDVDIVKTLLDSGEPVTNDLLATAAGGPQRELTLGFSTDAKAATPDESAAITSLLLDRGADPNGENASHVTPLLWATYGGRAATVRLLLDHGADPNRGGRVDSTLIRAAQGPIGNGDLVPQPRGAVVDNVPPIVAAAWIGNLDEATALLDAGGDPNVPADDAFTAMYGAAVLGNDAMVQLLLDRGAVPAPVVREGVVTPAQAARAAGRPDLADRLESQAG